MHYWRNAASFECRLGRKYGTQLPFSAWAPCTSPQTYDQLADAGYQFEVRAVSTRWLNACLALDAKGFIKTGPDLSPEDLATARWPLGRAPHLLETSLPGVFAIGDVRAGSLKRVASAVGEGSIAIAAVHQVLHE